MASLPGITGIDARKLRAILKKSRQTDAMLFEAIVDAPFEFKVETALLYLGIVVLLQVNKRTGVIDRVALSNTELATNTTNVSFVPFEEIKIPLDYGQNIIAKAISTNTPQETTDWEYLFVPSLTGEQARINQASGGIAYSAVYPLRARDGGALIFSFYQYKHEIGVPQHTFMKTYARLVDECLKT
jgi:hypothetical protein